MDVAQPWRSVEPYEVMIDLPGAVGLEEEAEGSSRAWSWPGLELGVAPRREVTVDHTGEVRDTVVMVALHAGSITCAVDAVGRTRAVAESQRRELITGRE